MKRFLISVILFSMFMALKAFAGDPFTVAGVKVDATGSNAIEAQTNAITEGQARAAEILLMRLTLPQQRAGKNLSAISTDSVSRMIRALNVSNEKRSNQRYLGDITVAFSPTEVQSFLAAQNLTMMSSQAEKRLLIPVMSGNSLWAENDWHGAWASGAFANSLTPVDTLSLVGGNDNLTSASQAASGDITALKRLGEFFGARQVLVAVAEPALGGIKVRISDIALDTGQKTNLGTISSASYDDAAWQVIEKLEDSWKSASVTLAQNAVTTPVSVLYRNHDDWINLQTIINSSAQIQGARLDALSKDGALMSVTYGGDFNRLRTELGYKGVEVRQDAELGTIMYRKGRY